MYQTPQGISVILYMPIFFMILNMFVLNRFIELITDRLLFNTAAKRRLAVTINILGMAYFLVLPSIIVSDVMTICCLSYIWLPQIIANFRFTQDDRKFHYSFKFLLVQSAILILLPFEARSGGPFFQQDYNYGVFSLRPHPQQLLKLIGVMLLQIVILVIQQSDIMRTIQRVCFMCPRWLPGRRKFLRKIREQRMKSLGQ